MILKRLIIAWNQWEIRLALNKMQDELFHFSLLLQRLFTLVYSLFPKRSKRQNKISKTEQLFKKDLIKQFKMLIKKDGKYSLQIYKKQGNFLERSKYNYIFDGGAYFEVEKKFSI